MNTPIISTKHIVTLLLVTSVSACSSFPEKRIQPRSQAETEQTMAAQDSDRMADRASSNQTGYSRGTDAVAQIQNVSQKRDVVRLKKSSSRKYTVKKGDTLWDISSQFLKDPWYWPEIWHKNRQVENPHLIYPGDVLTLIFIDGQPQIIVQEKTPAQTVHIIDTVETNVEGMHIRKLSPRMRKQGLDANVVTIPGDAIRQFLSKPRVVSQIELDNAAYILASSDHHIILGQDNTIYIRGELDKEFLHFTVFRPGKKLVDPDTEETLGYEATPTGEAEILEYGDPIVATLTSTVREVLLGDRLLPVDHYQIKDLYYPRVPEHEVEGKIISLYDALFGIARLQIAVINRGSRSGVEVGHLLETHAAGKTVDDDYTKNDETEITLPDERSGLLMIFRTFDKVSYGLLIESTNVINNHDHVGTPH